MEMMMRRTFGTAGTTRSLVHAVESLEIRRLLSGDPPANDLFADAMALTTGVQVTGDTTFATAEAGEPQHAAGIDPAMSIWWRWTADQTRKYLFDPSGSDAVTYLAIYSGTELGSLTQLAFSTGSTQFNAVAGQQYYIAIDSRMEEWAGTVNLLVSDVAGTAPPQIEAQTFSIAENAAEVTLIGTVQASDADAGQTLSYEIVAGDHVSWFSIDAATGALRVAAGAELNYEAQTQYQLQVRVTDDGTPALSRSTLITINLNDVNEAPIDIRLSSSVAENSPIGSALAVFVVEDPDAVDSSTLSLVNGSGDSDNAKFEIDGNVLRNLVNLNFEAQSSYSIRVQATDAQGLDFTAVITVQVADVNEAPATLSLTHLLPPGSVPAGATIGTFSASDPDAEESFTYALVGGIGDAAKFEVVGDQLRATQLLDYDSQTRYSVRVVVTDSGDLSFSRDIVIVLVSPSALAAFDDEVTMDEDTVASFGVLGNDNGGDGATLQIDSITQPAHGTATFTPDGTITYRPAQDYSGQDIMTYTVRDSLDNTATASVNITVTAMPDPLMINGTDEADVILIETEGEQIKVTMNGVSSFHDAGVVTYLSIHTGAGDDRIELIEGVPAALIEAGDGDDTIYGTSRNDTIYGGRHRDLIDAGDGDNVVYGQGNGDTITCGSGNDVVDGGSLADLINSGAGNDTVLGGTGDDLIHGGDGSDSIEGGDGNDTVYGEAGTDTIRGNYGNDCLMGGLDSDSMFGGPDDDTVSGQEGDDTLNGGNGYDLIIGWDGNDLIFARDGKRDRIQGNKGSDQAQIDDLDYVQGGVEELLA